MIVSYHPVFVGDRNLLCAGREPSSTDLDIIRSADAVILPQGCSEALYGMANRNCRHVFPNFEARFRYPGKTGQVRLFREAGVPHPETAIYPSVGGLCPNGGDLRKALPFTFPFVLKLDWGGEGDTVSLVTDLEGYRTALNRVRLHEHAGRPGFLLQGFVPSDRRSLRVVVIGGRFIAYWRVQEKGGEFRSNLARGAVIDTDSDPALRTAAVSSARQFCRHTGINLAGIDFLFPSEGRRLDPLFLEINYFFGREGIGGAERYYDILTAEIRRWISGLK